MSLGKRLIATDAAGGGDGSANFTPKLYSGGSAGQVISGVGFQPDLIIGKRMDSAEAWWDNDSLRSGKSLFPNTDDGQISFQYTTPNSDGFVVNGTGGVHNTGNLVAYCFKAGGAGSDIASSSTGVSAASRSVNAASGFSIVTYTMSSSIIAIPHGLSSAPKMAIVKRTNTTSDWFVYNSVVSGKGRGFLNKADQFDNSGIPTFGATDFTFQDSDPFSTGSVVVYFFADIAGYQKIGSYEGNGNDTGPTETTGFAVRFLMIKNADSNEGGGAAWLIYDSVRSTSNPRDKRLYVNENYQQLQDDRYDLDFLADGFQIKSGDTNFGYNNAGETYLYLAIA